MPKKNKSNSRISNRIKSSEQLISMIMGILVVLIVGGLAYRYFQTQDNDVLEIEENDQVEEIENQEGTTIVDDSGRAVYVVAENDNLWVISEKHYGSGYNWVDIASANELDNPGLLAVGQKLIIPDVETKQPTTDEPLAASEDVQVEEQEYTVLEGDSLSKLAGRFYGDIFEWDRIWEANKDKIANPDLIFPDQIITIPSK